jgi:hypothetical protein
MLNEGYKVLIKKAKEIYKGIKCIECPALNNEKIFFNRKGFQHLLYKKGDRRNKSDQINRLILIQDVVDIVRESQKYNELRDNGDIKFWSLVSIKNGMCITVVICQKGTGVKYFLSVMAKKHKTS